MKWTGAILPSRLNAMSEYKFKLTNLLTVEQRGNGIFPFPPADPAIRILIWESNATKPLPRRSRSHLHLLLHNKKYSNVRALKSFSLLPTRESEFSYTAPVRMQRAARRGKEADSRNGVSWSPS